jgi:hypothetical protein
LPLRRAALAANAGGGPGQLLFGGREPLASADAGLGDDLGDRRLDHRLVSDRRMADDDPPRLTHRRPHPATTGNHQPTAFLGRGKHIHAAANPPAHRYNLLPG